jgi:hypothetical protein
LRCTDHSFLVVSVLCLSLSLQHSSLANPTGRASSEIIELIRKHGQPDRVQAENGNKRAYHWHLQLTKAFGDDTNDQRLEDFSCDVAAIVASSGRIIRLRVEVANVGAEALASAGAFGPLCARSFGLRNLRYSTDAKRMHR